MPTATFTHSVTTEATAEEAWDALQKADTWSNIGPVASVSDPHHGDDGTLTGFTWVADIGGKTYPGDATTTAYVEPERFELTMDTSEIAGDVVATIEPTNPGCTVVVTITFRTKGMLSALFFPAIRQALATGFPRQVEDLVAAVER